MELWFILAVLSGIVGGFGAFGNKIAAQRKYDSKLVVIISGFTGICLFAPFALWFEGIQALTWPMVGVAFLCGTVTSFSQFLKIQGLHYIDSAIFLPLFKVLSPLVVILFGVILFSESFSAWEWIGLAISLLVPVMLVSRVEHSRQNNLTLGLTLIGVCAGVSGVAAVLQKYATELQAAPLWIVVVISLGIFVSALIQYVWENRGSFRHALNEHYSHGVTQIALLRTVFAGGGFFLVLLAYINGGPLGIVYTINSLYILPPIILAIIFYGEHWNFRKAFAIALSILALFLLQ